MEAAGASTSGREWLAAVGGALAKRPPEALFSHLDRDAIVGLVNQAKQVFRQAFLPYGQLAVVNLTTTAASLYYRYPWQLDGTCITKQTSRLLHTEPSNVHAEF